METIELALREDFFTSIFGGEEVDDDLRDILEHGVKQSEIGIPDPRKSEERGHATSVEACEALVESLLG